MPAVFDSLVADGMSHHKAWRVTFVVPLIFLIFCGLGLLLLTQDTPVGKWSERATRVQDNLAAHGVQSTDVVEVPGGIADRKPSDEEKTSPSGSDKDLATFANEAPISRTEALELAKGEVIVKPTLKEAMAVVFSAQAAFHVATYSCSFGGELAINSILSAYYKSNFTHLGQTKASNYAAIFGFLNFVTRPLGGIIADTLYNKLNRNLWAKKAWIHVCGVLTGTLLIIIGQVNPSESGSGNLSTLVGLVALMAIFLEAGNGANFALVPHVHPHANGILSGTTGAGGNMGGVIFAVIFRFMGGGKDYAKGLWVIGVIHIGMNLATSWIRPVPKGQIGGR